ncbi:2OG-Fe(II) oxygenase [Mesorhizobium sp. Root695]|uniref:alpha-ketoglutarate-dependent dioxygenase AlkB n=1 Tax=Mesorhizobium sp. Root695 TaxID=1736589 RepID=UPI00070D117F|nr:alpha-ketoglutarate-dependent dioxygenase AlkB [Mesorhizobium sp. Root695]KRB31410.1 2OG-Fe(II) oxygenase [Mesorhizobium sp. Root695]
MVSGVAYFQHDLFGLTTAFPDGFRYLSDLITRDDESFMVGELQELTFEPFDFHGHLANRHVASFGARYDYQQRQVIEAPPIPEFLLPLRQKVAAFAGIPEQDFAQVLINEYRPGAGIGWHRDKPHYESIAGVSLLAPCDFRLRRKNGEKWDRQTITVEPRSAYLISGPARSEWEHSIPPLAEHRYSITLRTLRVWGGETGR